MVHLQVDFDWSTRPLYDVIATIPGSAAKDQTEKDQWIIYGNHHDAWVNGASDPVSGASVLLETARTLSVLKQKGWQPKRTIILALWDGEEYGLLGSTEWVEKHMDELDRNAAVYINSDSTGRGPLVTGGSASLEPFVSEVLRDVTDPATSKSLLDAARDRRTPVVAFAGAPPPRAPQRERDFHVDSLGSGSDYVAFLDHAGIASLNLGFAAGDGVYHSIYDTPTVVSEIFRRRPDLRQGAHAGDEHRDSAAGGCAGTAVRFRFALGQRDPMGGGDSETTAAWKRQAAPLRSICAPFPSSLRGWRRQPRHTTKNYRPGPSAACPRLKNSRQVDESMRKAERALLTADGLPRRDWYRNQIYAPGMLTGYSAKTLPGVREAVEARQWDEANQQARKLAEALRAAAVQVEEATRLLKQVQ